MCKFGGSSVANAEQIKKVCNIVLSDESIRAVTVSAPGKRFDEDIKVTDMLIDLYEKFRNKDPKYKDSLEAIINRYQEIVNDLKLDDKILQDYRDILNSYLENIEDSFYLENAIKACGEDFNARLIAKYIKSLGVNCAYLSPKDAGILVEHTLSEPVILEKTYENLNKFKVEMNFLLYQDFLPILLREKL